MRYRRRAVASAAAPAARAAAGADTAARPFRVCVDLALWQGHAVCVAEAPEVFDLERTESGEDKVVLRMEAVKEIELFKKYIKGVSVVAVYGGTSIGLQIRDLKKGVQVVVATPGRLIDLIERKAINLEQIEYVVLDEADEMLNMGFQDDIEFILKNTPQRESTWLFSATMPPEIRKVSKRYMKDPVEVTVGKVNTANKSIDHQYYVTSAQHRYQTLKRIIDFNPGIYGIIFTRTKVDAQEISERLTREGYDIDA